MPELPEVETVRRGLEPWLTGARIKDVSIFDPRLTRPVSPSKVEKQLRGARVKSLGRRGKYLLFELDNGLTAVHHLRMTGSFDGRPAKASADDFTHVRMEYVLAKGIVRYRDPRRFGTLEVGTHDAVHAKLNAALGPEPLGEEFTATALRARLKGRRAPIKAALLDQRTVAGLGNIYVDEALHIAGIDPRKEAGTLSLARTERLVDAIVARLTEAIEVGGSTLRDYRGVAGEAGGMQERFLVYGRAGEPCGTCGRTLRGGRIAGRATVWCGHCQRP
jgi:formamidopyrimidine-DNA glycosylase